MCIVSSQKCIKQRWGSNDKESACNAGDLGSIPGSGRSPGEGIGCSLQYACLENFMDRGAWQAAVHGFSESQTQLNDWVHSLLDVRGLVNRHSLVPAHKFLRISEKKHTMAIGISSKL